MALLPRRRAALSAVVGAVLLGSMLLAGHQMLVRQRSVAATFRQAPSPDAAPSVSPSPAPPPSPTPVASRTVDPTAAVRAQAQGYVTAQGGHAAVEVVDRVTGLTVQVGDGQRFETASVVKADILATLLLQAQRAGHGLTATQKSLATAMITQSDNDAASSLWDTIGGASGLAAANRTFGLGHTTPGSDGAWGLTTTTVGDQVRLLRVLTDASSPLSAANRGYELGLMSRVESDQRWGITAAATKAASAVAVKNGWLYRGADDDMWIINSVGRITEPGHDWLVAVLSNQRSSESGGIAMVEHLATLTVGGLRG